MEIGLVKRVDIDQEMQQSYLDYAMSVIVARALPDARDGLKPVQRRILYGMYDMGLRADSSYKKSARIVGEVLGKYHPHGDQTVYEAMARMAQDFSMRYPLVDGQGNFGSVDGDPPAAMRYTEARLTPAAVDILVQLDRDTIDFTRNFDDSLNEPDVLPAAIPNLLVNGASGIAVGMATSIPPHNMGEVIDALNYLLERWESQEDVTVSDLMKYVKGPDFPTGGIILHENNGEDLLSAYATGRGKVTLRGKIHLEEMGRGKNRIIITELPYQINKSSLIERIAELVREGGLEGISDLRDESDRQGMRIVIELNKVAATENLLRDLYRRTPLQSTFRISLLALVDGEPHMLSLKQALRVYLEHRITVVRRRSEFDLAKAKARAHILEGLRVALNNLDEVISLIRKAQDVEDARGKLMKRFKLTELQANAILEMQLRRLAALERRKIELEYKEVHELIGELEGLLHSPKKLRLVVGDELKAMKIAYSDRRRTQIVALKDGAEMRTLLTTHDLMPTQNVWVGVTADGLIGRTTGDTLPRWSGRNAPHWVYATNTHQTLFLAASDGRAAAIAVQSLPEVERFEDGVPLRKVSPFEEEQKLVLLFSAPTRLEENDEHYIVTVSRAGLVKKSSVRDLPGPSTQLFSLAKVNAGDEIGWAVLTDGNSELLLATRKGMVIRFTEEDVRPMGLVAAGVNGIKLASSDQLIGAARILPEFDLLLVGKDGKAWRLPTAQLPVQGRYGQGVMACKPQPGAELIALAYSHAGQEVVIQLKDAANKVETIGAIPAGRRQSTARQLITLKPGDQITGLTLIEDGLAYWEKRQVKPQKRTRRVAVPENQADQLALPLDGLAARKQGAAAPKKEAVGKQKTEPAAKASKTAAEKPKDATTPRLKTAAARTKRAAATPKPSVKTVSKPAAVKAKTATTAPSTVKTNATKAAPKTRTTAAKTTTKVATGAKLPAKKAAKAVASKPSGKSSTTVSKTTKTSKTTKSSTKPASKPAAKTTTRPPTKLTVATKKPAVKKPTAGTGKAGSVKTPKTQVRKPKTTTK